MNGCTPGQPSPDGHVTWLAEMCDTLDLEVGAATDECYAFCVQQLVESQPHPLALPEPPMAIVLLLGVAFLIWRRRG